MSAFKHFFLLIVLTSIVKCDEKSHNWSMGTLGPNDRLLFGGVIKQDKNLFGLRKAVEDVKFPDITNAPLGPNAPVITYIRAIDQYQDGNGGYVSILDGGVGESTVTLHLKSKRFHGFNFIIEIYGRDA